jgi:hypothetical protein
MNIRKMQERMNRNEGIIKLTMVIGMLLVVIGIYAPVNRQNYGMALLVKGQGGIIGCGSLNLYPEEEPTMSAWFRRDYIPVRNGLCPSGQWSTIVACNSSIRRRYDQFWLGHKREKTHPKFMGHASGCYYVNSQTSSDGNTWDNPKSFYDGNPAPDKRMEIYMNSVSMLRRSLFWFR